MQVSKVLHHHECLVVVLRRDLAALGDLSQDLRTRCGLIVERVDQRLPIG